MNEETSQLLYSDIDGSPTTLDEVQLIDPAPLERVPALQALLTDGDPFVAYQAALILTAWGDDAGLSKLEEMIDRRVERQYSFAPHRLYGYDNVYDEIADAVSIFLISRPDGGVRARHVYEKLLMLYGEVPFESRLKWALLKKSAPKMVNEVKGAIDRSLANGREYLGSQLLPVLARWDPEAGWAYTGRFLTDKQAVPSPAANVAEALKFIRTPDARALATELQQHPAPGVSDEARRSLAALDGQARSKDPSTM